MTPIVLNVTSGRGGEGRMAERVADALTSGGMDSRALSIADAALHPRGRMGMFLDEDLISPRFLSNLRRRARSANLIVDHYIFNFSSLAIAAWLALACRKKVAVVFHNHMDGGETALRRTLYWIRRAVVLNALCLFTRRLVFLSEAGRTHFRAVACIRRLFDRKGIVIPNFIESSNAGPGQASRPGPFRALYVGRLSEMKGFGDALAVMDELGREGIQFDIVGEGPFADRIPRAEGIAWRPSMTPAELAPLFSGAHALLFPSRSEAFGLVILEAMASGTPVVVSDLPSIREMIEEGKTGLLVSPRDVEGMKAALRKLRDNPLARERMGEAALRASARFTDGESQRRYVEMCRAILAER